MTSAQVELPSIDQVAHTLGLPQSEAAEAQGLLCGLVCALGGNLDPKGWREQVLEGQEQANPAQERMLQQVFDATVTGLFADDLHFRLLLPPDSAHLGRRAECLGGWCEGFLLGLGLGGVRQGSTLPKDTREILSDFSEIARAGLDGAEVDEAEENAYAEVVEYVRMSALLVYDELAPLREGAGSNTLH